MVRRTMSSPPVLAGYSYVRPLGAGGFADVFLYEQDLPRRVCAVKVLLADAVNPEVLRTFNIEADVSARLSAHSAIVTIYQASIASDGRPFIAMEYCPDSMSARYKSGSLSLADVLDTGVRIAGALETVHRAGLLHRDIKPSNILINSLGNPVLADFGIAAEAVDDSDSSAIALSIPWSAPEVLQERVRGSVSSEVWSLAATLYTLFAGRSPFESPDRSQNTRDRLMRRIVKAHYTPVPVTGFPPMLDEILSTAMRRDPSARFSSMAEFADRLRWAQYQLGATPTAFEAASTEWASAAPVNFADATQRGPVVTTVDPNSRRAARAARQDLGPRDTGDRPRAAGRRSPVFAVIFGAGVGVAVLAAIGMTLLRMFGVI